MQNCREVRQANREVCHLSVQVAESMGFKGDFRQWEDLLEDARRTLGIVALSLALSMGYTIPQGASPAVTKTVPELEIVPRYNRFLQLLEDVIVAATFEAFAVVGLDVDRAIVVDVDLCVGFSHDAR